MPVELSNVLDEPWLESWREEEKLLRSGDKTIFGQLSEFVWVRNWKEVQNPSDS